MNKLTSHFGVSASIVEHLKSTPRSEDTIALHFYCSYKDPSTQSFRNLLCNATSELMRKEKRGYEEILAVYRSKQLVESNPIRRADGLSTNELLSLLKKLSRRWTRVLMLVDALDECLDLNEFNGFARGLKLLCTAYADGGDTTIQVLVTSRNGWYIENKVAGFATMQLSLMTPVQSDIDLFLRTEVERRLESGQLKLRKRELVYQIMSSLKDRSDGMLVNSALHFCLG
jgi:hypothetical protein